MGLTTKVNLEKSGIYAKVSHNANIFIGGYIDYIDDIVKRVSYTSTGYIPNSKSDLKFSITLTTVSFATLYLAFSISNSNEEINGEEAVKLYNQHKDLFKKAAEDYINTINEKLVKVVTKISDNENLFYFDGHIKGVQYDTKIECDTFKLSDIRFMDE